MLAGTSSLGRRVDEPCILVLEAAVLEDDWVLSTVGVMVPRDLTATEGFGTGTRWLVAPLLGYTCSSLVGFFFCSLEWPATGDWNVVDVVGVADLCGSRVVGVR